MKTVAFLFAAALAGNTACSAQDVVTLAASADPVANGLASVPTDVSTGEARAPQPDALLPEAAPDDPDFTTTGPGYKIRWKYEVPATVLASAWAGYCFTKIYSKPTSTEDQIRALDRDDIPRIDRWAAGKSDDKLDDLSDIPFYGAIPVPLLLIGLDPKVRRDAGHVAMLYWETMAITGTLYTSATYFVDRYRPEAYTTEKAPVQLLGGGFKNSFFAGHVAHVSSITFFTAKVFNDYHPRSPWRWAFWGGATAVTGGMIYLRHAAGKHFPTDLALGTAVGVGAGILVPHFHRTRKADGRGLSVAPMVGPANGMTLTYNF